MEIMAKKYLLIIPLIALVGFLFFPQNALADNFEDITPAEVEKYLGLPGEDAEKILDSLHQVMTDKGIDLITSVAATDQQIAVVAVLDKVSKIHILNHLLIDAPIEITGKIIKTAVDMARLFGAKDISVVIDKFEKETVNMAIDYAMKKLFQDEIKVTPGAIQFKYKSYQGEQKEVVLQYIIIYQPLGDKKGKVEIRFYSPNPIEPPGCKGSVGVMRGIYHDLQHDLPPFITEISGTVEKTDLEAHRWIKGPSIKITFPDSVPDFGIKPLTFWERHLLKPIETAIKNIEVIITKVTGKSLGIVNIWERIKSTFSRINPFGPAAVVETSLLEREELEEEELEIEEQSAEVEQEVGQAVSEPKLSLDEIQERLKNISERIAATNEEAREFSESEEKEEEIVEEEVEEIEETEEVKEIEETREEAPEEEETPVTICEITPGTSPVRDKVIINEVAWMGTTNSASDEWIELKNLSNSRINLAGWQLLDKEKQIKIIFEEEIIPAGGFCLLERTDDDSMPGVTADKIYTGGLRNTNEALYLSDENCQLQDEVLADPDWPDGDNHSKRTMERKSNLNWQTSNDVGGTPKSANSSGYHEYHGGGGSSGNGGSSDSGSSAPAPDTESPVANAGPEQTVEINEATTFDGSASTDNVGIVSYYWDIDDDGQWDLEGVTSILESGYSQPGEYLVTLKVSDAASNVSADTLTVTVNPLSEPQDVISPAVISDLTAETGDEEGEILLSWTASGDDGNEGRATEYIIKRSQKEIIESDWDLSAEVSNEIIPQEAGSKENLAVSGLTPGVTYFFAIKSKDDADNLSGISNSTSAWAFQMLPPPKILISEIQIEALENVSDEFIELYNPNDQDVDLTGFALKKKTSSGSESNLVSSAGFSDIIASLGYFLIVPQLNDDGSPNYQGEVSPDLYYSGKDYSIAADNTILLYDRCNNLIDKVGWGEAQDFETAPAENPSPGQSLGRKWDEDTQGYQDTDDNSQDFEVQISSPRVKNQPLPPEPTYLPAVGHNIDEGDQPDRANLWEDEPRAYDDNTDTFAKSKVTPTSWTAWLELFPPTEKSQGVRFWIDAQSQISFFRVELLYSNYESWDCLKNWNSPYSSAPKGEWVILDYPKGESSVEKARVKFNTSLWGSPREVRLNEFQFKINP